MSRKAVQRWIFCLGVFFMGTNTYAEDGYRLWLKYDKIKDSKQLGSYRQNVSSLLVQGTSGPEKALQEELRRGLSGLLGKKIQPTDKLKNGSVVAGIPETSPLIASLDWSKELKSLGAEGYLIRSTTLAGHKVTVIASESAVGALYGAFHLLRLIQTRQPIEKLNITEKPGVNLRVLNHWDNLDGSIERGYAGKSLWNWAELPEKMDSRLKDYARANASIGINGAVLNNVNSDPLVLTEEYLHKAAAIASVFRPYGLKVYLSANFGAPKRIGKMATSDPLDQAVIEWWKKKADEIYGIIPDFGGFLVKANSEGQSGPQDYGRSHRQGANMLAGALKPHGGIVMWRAFVYNASLDPDRVNRAYMEFQPEDGKFLENVLVQSKNGALDFQPREPFAPLFGGLKKTPILAELQVTQEYLGHSTHLVYLAPMWEEFFKSDTYAKSPSSTVAEVVEGKVFPTPLTGIAGVANTGSDRNWTGHPFGQANWYAFGRLAWDPNASSKVLAEEWARMTLSNNPKVVAPIVEIMLSSRETFVDYVTPLGLAGVFEKDLHYAPDPGMVDPRREDWSAAYYVRADNKGLGFDRTSKGSNNVDQYYPPLNKLFNDPKTCPEKFLLWFHHIPWEYPMKSGRTFWDELCFYYGRGVKEVEEMQKKWKSLKGKVNGEVYNETAYRLSQQVKDAHDWKDKCLHYFQGFSKMPIPQNQ